MPSSLRSLFFREQRAFLSRNREGWDEHLTRIRTFLGEGLKQANPNRPVLILGAGSGLEVPWHLTPKDSHGWDMDPLGRLRTFMRHRRWPPWVVEDITGALGPFQATVHRAVRETWSGKRRHREAALIRVIALMDALHPEPTALLHWIKVHHPGSILCANFLGQIAPTAQRLVENAFAPEDPWEKDPDRPDPLMEALDRWTAKTIRAVLQVLRESGAALCMVHDRAVLDSNHEVALKETTPGWREQLQSEMPIEAWDPLGGVDVLEELRELPVQNLERWLWPVGEGQLHLMEGLFAVPVRSN